MAHKNRHPTLPQDPNSQESKMVRDLDTLRDYDYYQTTIAPKIRNMIRRGYTQERMRKELAPLVQARVLSIALSGSAKSQVTLNAAKDILDRAEGMATQKMEITKKYQTMNKEELKALANQRMKELGIIEVEAEEDSGPDARASGEAQSAGRSETNSGREGADGGEDQSGSA